MVGLMDTSIRCVGCKFFEKKMDPSLDWFNRKERLKDEYGLPDDMAASLAENKPDCFGSTPSNKWGVCKHPEMFELRDVELDGTKFGCIYYKKK
jgi:hypothetical protein